MAGNQRIVELSSLEEWDDCRAHFNHDWLRNRWAIALGKLANVLNGNVDDPGALAEMRVFLQEWNERRPEAERLLSRAFETLAPSRFLTGRMFSDIDGVTKNFYGEVADAAWRKSERVDARANDTERALHELNQLCLRMADSFSKGDDAALINGRTLQELVEEMRNAVSCLSAAITELGRCKRF